MDSFSVSVDSCNERCSFRFLNSIAREGSDKIHTIETASLVSSRTIGGMNTVFALFRFETFELTSHCVAEQPGL